MSNTDEVINNSGPVNNGLRDAIIANDSGGRKIAGNLDKYPNVFTSKEAYHLLRRVSFGPTPEAVNQLIGMTVDQAVPLVLGSNAGTAPTGPSWVDTLEDDPLTVGNQILRSDIEGRLQSRYVDLGNWWVELMRADTAPYAEKLTHFLTDVWCVDFSYDTEAYIPPGLLYRNNQKLRADRLARYQQIMTDMTFDGAFLLFQSLFFSTKEKPNENYMREFMELFSMGIGNYSEGDIKEGARSLTGWRANVYLGTPAPNGVFATYFDPTEHDIGAKTFMLTQIPAIDQTSNTEFQGQSEVQTLINILFKNHESDIGKFVCNKIYRYFVYSNPGNDDSSVISDMTQVFIDAYDTLGPVYQSLFSSVHFYDDSNIGVQIKTPPEFIIGLERQLGIKYANARQAIFDLGQDLYQPPNVGGWKGYRTWISTATFPQRVYYARDMLSQANTPDATLISLAKKFANYTDPTSLVQSLEEYFFPLPGPDRLQRYLQTLLTAASAQAADWAGLINSGDARAALGIRSLILTFILAPDFQLT